MGKRKGKFIGAYISGDLKRQLQREAAAQDRPLTYVIAKVLAKGVKHLEAGQGPEIRRAA